MYLRVEAGPKLSRKMFDVVIALDAVTLTELMVEGIVAGSLTKLRYPALFCMDWVDENVILLMTFAFTPLVLAVTMEAAFKKVPMLILLVTVTRPTNPAVLYVERPCTVI